MKERLFVAVPLPEDIRDYFSGQTKEIIRQSACPVTVVSRDSMHITLIFIGETDTTYIPDICESFRKLKSKHKRFRLSFDTLDFFPNSRNPRTLIVRMKDDLSKINALHNDLGHALDELQINYDRKPFNAHMTLARVRSGAAPMQLLNLVKEASKIKFDPYYTAVDVSNFILFKSDLTWAGPVYTPEAVFELA